MKIEELKIKNFINHANTEIKPSRVNMILGMNQSGKSAIRDALSFGIIGTARGMDGREGKDNLVMNRLGKAEVEIILDNLKILRNTNNRLAINDQNKDIKTGQNEILDAIGVNAETLAILFETDKIFSMNKLERSKYFSRIFSAKISAEEFANILRKQFSQEIVAIILPYYNNGLKKVYEEAVKKRRTLKNELESLENMQSPFSIIKIENIEYDLDKLNETELKKKIDECNSKILKLRAKRDNEIKLQEVVRIVENNIKYNQNKIQELESYILFYDGTYKGQIKDTIEIEKEENLLAKLQSNLAAINKDITNNANIIAVINSLSLCEQCSGKLQFQFATIQQDLLNQKNEIEKEISVTMEKILKLKTQLGHDIRKEYENKVKEIEEYKINLEKAEKEAKEVDYNPAILQNIESEGRLIEHQREVYKKLQDYLKEYANRIAEYGSIEMKIAKKKIEIETWDKLAQFVNPESNNLVNPILKKLADRVKYTAQLFGNNISINEDTWDILYKNIPLEYCSVSEKYEASMIIQDAISYLLGVGILFLDGAEIFVGDRRKVFSNAIKTLEKDYNNIFVFASTDKKPIISAGQNNIIYFWVESGKVEQING